MLEVDNVEKYFDAVQLLYGIHLKAEKGKITGILGSNGCGKSTLLKIIFGTMSSKYKLIKLDGEIIQKPLLTTGNVKYLPQHHFIPNYLTIKEILSLYQIQTTDFESYMSEEQFSSSQRFGNLSGGQRRIIEVFICLKSEAKVVMLDEPFSHIAPVQVERIKELMHQEKQHKAIVITDHLYRDIVEVSDSLYLIKNGSTKRINALTELEDYKYISQGSL